jgi:SAM-dependent methyltransferase
MRAKARLVRGSHAVTVLFMGMVLMGYMGAIAREVTVEGFDSGTRVVREVAEALTGKGQSIRECYPWGSRAALGLISLFPENTRISLVEWGMRLSVGHASGEAADLDVGTLPRWCVGQYPQKREYEAIVVGSPNGAAAHLAALLGAPFLTSSFGLTFRHPTIDAGDHLAYLASSRAIVDAILAGNDGEGFELVAHYDPLHDRPLVRVADFVRVKLLGLPECYKDFIHEHLAPGGTLVILDCAYRWPQYQLGGRAYLQVGGLGAVDPDTYLERWPFDLTTSIRRESEWGCPEEFAAAAASYAAERGIDVLTISFSNPFDYSLLAYRAYLACDQVRGRSLVIDCFNHSNPRTNIETGIPALWLPFNTMEGLALVEAALDDKGPLNWIGFAPLPSFAQSPDTASIDKWIDLLPRYGELELLGIDPHRFPADPLAPFRFAERMMGLRDELGLDRPLRLDVEALTELVSPKPKP